MKISILGSISAQYYEDAKSMRKYKGNHCRVGGFICDKKSCHLLIYINFSFDFLGLDNVYFFKLLRQLTHQGTPVL
jgi:hypothetical protein